MHDAFDMALLFPAGLQQMSIYVIHITLFYGCAGRIAAID